MKNLTVELRPRAFSEIVGHKKILDQIKKAFAERTPTSLIFSGEPGTGKSTVAKIIALCVQDNDRSNFGEPSAEVLRRQHIYSIIERNCAEMSTVEAARDLLPILMQSPTTGEYRVIILDEAQQQTATAQNVMNLPLENENFHNIVIYCTTDPAKIIASIKSRSMLFTFPLLGLEESTQLITATVAKLGKTASKEKVDRLAGALVDNLSSSGRNIVMAVDRMLSGASIAEAVIVQETGTIDFNALSRELINGNWNACRAILAQATPADAATIRVRSGGYLRKVLLELGPGNKAQLLSRLILRLGEPTVYEAGLQLSLVCACIYSGCEIVNKKE